MSRGSQILDVSDFRLGLNVAVPAAELEPGEASDIMNLVCDQHGALHLRAPDSTLTTLGVGNGSSFTSLSVIENGFGFGANARVVCLTSNGKLFWQDLQSASGAFFSGSFGSDPWTFLRMPAIGGQGPYWGMNGSSAPRQISTAMALGNWTATTGTLPNGKFMVYANNRVWVAGVASNPNALYWSEVGDPTNWPVENVTQFGVADGTPITGLGTVGSYLLVFKANAIWRVYDLDTSANVKITGDVGTAAPQSIVDAGGACYFLDREKGVCTTDGQGVQVISDKVLPLAKYMAEAANPSPIAAFFDNTYYISGALGGAFNSATLAFDARLGSWWVHDYNAQVFATATQSGFPALLACTGTTLKWIMGDASFGTPTIPWRWAGAQHNMGAPQVAKRIRELILRGQLGVGETLDVAVSSEFETVNDSYPAVDLHGTASLFSLGSSMTWRPRFSGANTALGFNSYSLVYDVRRGKG